MVFEASVRKFLSIFGGAARRKAPASGSWNMDLRSLGGSMTGGRTEPVNLPKGGQNPKKPMRPPPAPDGAAPRTQANGYPAQPRRREEPPPPRPEPPPAHRSIPPEARDTRSPGGPPGGQVRPPAGRAPPTRSREEAGARQPGGGGDPGPPGRE